MREWEGMKLGRLDGYNMSLRNNPFGERGKEGGKNLTVAIAISLNPSVNYYLIHRWIDELQ